MSTYLYQDSDQWWSGFFDGLTPAEGRAVLLFLLEVTDFEKGEEHLEASCLRSFLFGSEVEMASDLQDLLRAVLFGTPAEERPALARELSLAKKYPNPPSSRLLGRAADLKVGKVSKKGDGWVLEQFEDTTEKEGPPSRPPLIEVVDPPRPAAGTLPNFNPPKPAGTPKPIQ